MNTYTYIRRLIHVILSLESEKEVEDFLRVILTDKEINTISTRLEILDLLMKKYPQREIAEKLQVGIATITHGSKEIKLKRFKTIEEKL